MDRASQFDENSSDSSTTLADEKTSGVGHKDEKIFPDEEEDLELGEEDVIKFDFEASINAKKNNLNNVSSSANLQALAAGGNTKPPNEEFAVDSGEGKEKLEVVAAMKGTKKKTFAFDMFADNDEEFETVSS